LLKRDAKKNFITNYERVIQKPTFQIRKRQSCISLKLNFKI